MNYTEAKRLCHVRSALRRTSRPGVLYWKNHSVPFDDRVPLLDKLSADWQEFDPREEPGCSAYGETPA